MNPPVAIVGAGWAGLAAAVELTEAGTPVQVFESARQAGGRARRVDWHGLAIDNGQHLMIGAYRETLRLMDKLGTLDTLERRRLDFRLPGFRLALPRLPAPLHLAIGLATCRGLSWSDKLSAVRLMRQLEASGFRLAEDLDAQTWLVRAGQSVRLVNRLWAPICIAALNTPLAQASAQMFCTVLRDSLAGPRAASDWVMNRADLGRLVPDAALEYLQARGSAMHLSTRVEAIEPTPQGFRLHHGERQDFERVILAVHPAHVPALLPKAPGLDALRATLASYAWQPILTLWLRFERLPALPYPMHGLSEGDAPWAFEREDLAPGLVAVVHSAEGPHLEMPRAALRDRYLDLLARVCGPLPALLDWTCIVEKRATFACTPDLPRPGCVTPLPGLFLAGDYTDPDYPATLEAAVRSGVKCARTLLAQTLCAGTLLETP